MGLGTGIAARVGSEYQRDRNFDLETQAFTEALTDNPEQIIDTAYSLEADWDTEVARRHEILGATNLSYPTLEYDREMSKRMI